MKKESIKMVKYYGLWVLFIILFVVPGCSFGGMSGNSKDAEDSVITTHLSIENVEYDSVVDSETTKEEVFTSPDLKLNQLQGHVKTVIEKCQEGDNMIWEYTIRFDQKGTYIPDKEREERVYRNKSGQIIKTTIYGGDGSTIYKYNEDGYVISDISSEPELTEKTTYELNEKGWTKSSTLKSGKFKEISTYTYGEEDEYGNWLRQKRSIKTNDKIVGSSTYIITRKITYWE